jgi:hypothetical protein
MLAELKDLIEKGLFTAVSFLASFNPIYSREIVEIYSPVQAETKQIMKKRTAFETALVRRVPKKSDFVRYVAYEMGLEQLRRKRVDRLRTCFEEVQCSKLMVLRYRITTLATLCIRLCPCPQTVSYLRTCTQEVQVRRGTMDTICSGCQTRRGACISRQDNG